MSEPVAADDKVRAVFGRRVVDKGLTRLAGLEEFPRYVLEYLIGEHCRSEETFTEDIEKVYSTIRRSYADRDRRDALLTDIKQRGRGKLIAFVEVRYEEKEDRHWAAIPSLNLGHVHIANDLLLRFPGLIQGGMWGLVEIEHDPEEIVGRAHRPFKIIDFRPLQVGFARLDDYVAARRQFTTEEWIDLLVTSLGLNPRHPALTRRRKLLLISRAIPLVENNTNSIELGPRETGKTYLMRNLSYYSHVISGGKTTPAALFVNLLTNQVGLVGGRDAVVFDEIASTQFTDPLATVSLMKDYMQSGRFSRGRHEIPAFASLVFLGNIDVVDGQPSAKYPHYFDELPDELVDTAFLDRMHIFLPGWEIPKISPELYARGYGLVSDYFCEILHELRGIDGLASIRPRFRLCDGITGRDERSVLKALSGLMKLLYPHGSVDDAELHESLDLACEFRQRVRDQLHILASGEFEDYALGYAAPSDGEMRLPPRPRKPEPFRVVLPDEPRIGEVNGLAVVGQIGCVLQIDVRVIEGTGRLTKTGNIHKIMGESLTAAYDFVRANSERLGITRDFRRDYDIHVHIRRIAEPKEGPSAGVTLAVGLVSALTDRPVRPRFAMTGEITINGLVLGVGGVDEKLRAAAAAGATDVLLPEENRLEAEGLPPSLSESLRVHLVDSVDQALELCLLPSAAGGESSPLPRTEA